MTCISVKHINKMGDTVQEKSIKVITRMGTSKPHSSRYQVCRLAPASYVVRSFTMGKVYPTRASFSQSLPSMQTKIPRGLEGRSPRNPPRISNWSSSKATEILIALIYWSDEAFSNGKLTETIDK